MGYLGFRDPPACILPKISSERVSWLDEAGIKGHYSNNAASANRHSHLVDDGFGTRGPDTINDLLRQLGDMTISGVEAIVSVFRQLNRNLCS